MYQLSFQISFQNHFFVFENVHSLTEFNNQLSCSIYLIILSEKSQSLQPTQYGQK